MVPSGVTPIFILAVLLAVFESGLCVRCYQCVSNQNPHCKDPFSADDRLVTKDCFSQEVMGFNNAYLNSILGNAITPTINAPRYCHKIELESGIVIRTCLEGTQTNINRTCELLANSPGQYDSRIRVKQCSSCDTDGCNSASGLMVSLPLAIGAVILSFIIAKL